MISTVKVYEKIIKSDLLKLGIFSEGEVKGRHGSEKRSGHEDTGGSGETGDHYEEDLML